MLPKTCSTPECVRPAKVRGMCQSHYNMAIRSGKILKISKSEMFWSKVRETDTCWEWAGATDRGGYGKFKMHGRTVVAHRHSFELHFGEVPEGKQVDHMCHNRACVRPDHLRPVTVKQNSENRLPGRKSKSGVLGVHWNKREMRWIARVGHNGKTFHVGYFDNIADAEVAVIAKRNELFTHNLLDRIPA